MTLLGTRMFGYFHFHGWIFSLSSKLDFMPICLGRFLTYLFDTFIFKPKYAFTFQVGTYRTYPGNLLFKVRSLHTQLQNWFRSSHVMDSNPSLSAFNVPPKNVAQWITVDGSEIWETHQLRLVVYPVIYGVLAPSQVVVWDVWTIKGDKFWPAFWGCINAFKLGINHLLV